MHRVNYKDSMDHLELGPPGDAPIFDPKPNLETSMDPPGIRQIHCLENRISGPGYAQIIVVSSVFYFFVRPCACISSISNDFHLAAKLRNYREKKPKGNSPCNAIQSTAKCPNVLREKKNGSGCPEKIFWQFPIPLLLMAQRLL